MIVLGVTDGISCGAAVVVDGEVVAAINEEALVRLKMAYGFPHKSISECLRVAGVGPQDVDLVTVATINNHFSDGIRAWDGWFERDAGVARNAVFSIAGKAASLASLPGVEKIYYRTREPIFKKRRQKIREIIAKNFGISAELEFVNHHLAHCASAYFTSGFDNALALSMDGGGDGDSSHVYTVDNGRFTLVGQTTAFNSIGNYYSYVTEVCGFKAQKHEGKITGLAAHGEAIYLDVLDSLITYEDGQLKNIGKAVFRGGMTALLKRLPKNWKREDLAASIQIHSENLAVKYVGEFLKKYRKKNLAIAGGLFANVRINQKLAEIEGVERFFVHPGMSDAGLAVGSALSACMADRKTSKMPAKTGVMGNVYLGLDFCDDEIETALEHHSLDYLKPSRIESDVADLLAAGHVVARFNGSMEYGPRALGNRSILYHPGDCSVNDWLNELLDRTEFMPFAPSTNIEHADQHYLSWRSSADSARFMTITFDCTDWMKKHCAGVVHVDGTARPQLVRQDCNPSYHKIIDEFYQRTGVGTVINTSFNMHEEPIVCTPDDAVRSFLQGHLDYLAIGDYLVKSPEPVRHEMHPMASVMD